MWVVPRRFSVAAKISQRSVTVETTTDPLARIELLRRIAVSVNHEAESAIRGWARTNPVVADYQRQVDAVREIILTQAFLDIGIDEEEAGVLARIGLTILVGTQQIEDKVDRQRLDGLLSEYQDWLQSRRNATPRRGDVAEGPP